MKISRMLLLSCLVSLSAKAFAESLVLEVEPKLSYAENLNTQSLKINGVDIKLEELYLPFKMCYYVVPVKYSKDLDIVLDKQTGKFYMVGDPFWEEGILFYDSTKLDLQLGIPGLSEDKI